MSAFVRILSVFLAALAAHAGSTIAGLSAPAPRYAQVQAPLPPVRPSPTEPARPPAPGQPQPAGSEAPPSLDRVNAYFNAMKGLRANFVQISPDGRRFGGVLHLLRPGRMRFEYSPPAALEIISDGRSVAIRDRRLNTQDLYLIGQTPLKFLLQPRIDVARDSKVVGLSRSGPDIVLDLEDRSTFGGTSTIRVAFDAETHALKEWTVTDSQGGSTRVMLSDLDLAAVPDKALFVIDDQLILNPR
jgi:outer membrane lipoprotein-sorting protein